jgi:hypothetical protein
MKNEVSIISGKGLAGCPVRTADGTILGEAVDILVDSSSGYVLYVVLQVAPPTGDSNALYPVPWGAVEIEEVDGRPTICFDVTADRLQHAPSFHRQMWPNLASDEWRRALHNHYSIPAYWHEMSSGRA